MPFETAVRLEFERFQGFVEQYSANLSLGGMFINSPSPPPLGSEVAVEFRLGDGYELIRGRGRVVWVRPEGDDDPSGFGLRFLELTPGSRELIFRLVERRVREGEPVFDVDEKPRDRALPGDEDGAHLASPPWDLPAPRNDEEARSAALGGDETGRGVAPRFGSAVRATDPPRPEEEVLAAVASGEIDPEVSFAGITDDDEDEAGSSGEGGGPGDAVVSPAGEAPRPFEVLPAIDGEAPQIAPSAGQPAGAAADGQAPPGDRPHHAGWPWTEGEEARGATAPQGDATVGDGAWPWASPLAEPAADEVAEGEGREIPHEVDSWPEPASREADAAPKRPRSGGRRWLAAAAVGLVVVAGGLFLLLRAPAGPTGADPAIAGERAAAVPVAATTVEPPSAAGSAAALPATEPAGDAAPPQRAGAPQETVPVTPGSGPGSIDRIDWQRRAGGVDFEIAGAGAIAPGAFDHFRVGGEQPRFVVRIAGVERPYARGAIDVGGPLVARVRTGFHPAEGGSAGSLHVVFDLAPPGSAVATVESDAGRLRIRFEAP